MPASTTEARVQEGARSATMTWRVWVPCLGMALCSWLAFVDRQVWAVLSPTILADTGLTAQEFGDASSFFFLAYMIANPALGFDSRLRRPCASACCWPWPSGRPPACRTRGCRAFWASRWRAPCWGLGEGATFPGRLEDGRRVAAGQPARPRDRDVVQRRHHWRDRDAAHGGTHRAEVRVAGGVPLHGRARHRMADVVGGDCPSAVSAGGRAQADEDGVAEPVRDAESGRSCSATRLPALAPGPILTILPFISIAVLGISQAELNQVFWIPPLAWGVGYFFWGWAADRFAANNRRPVGMFLLLTVCSLASAPPR